MRLWRYLAVHVFSARCRALGACVSTKAGWWCRSGGEYMLLCCVLCNIKWLAVVSRSVILFRVWVDGGVCVCVLRWSERRGCAYFRLRVYYEYVPCPSDLTLWDVIRVFDILLLPVVVYLVVYVSSALCRLLGNCVSVKARRWWPSGGWIYVVVLRVEGACDIAMCNIMAGVI